MDIQQASQKATAIGIEELYKLTVEKIKNSPIKIQTVMQALNEFEDAYIIYYNLIKARRVAKEHKDQIRAAGLKAEIKDLQRPVYEKFFDFQNKFNLYFGQIIQMVFLYRDEDGQLQLGLSNNDLSHVVENQFGGLEYSIQGIQQELILQDANYDSSSIDEAANSIYDRWEVAKRVYKKSTYLPILWYLNGQWDGRKVNNKGTIAEAYANLYINQIVLEGDLEYKVAQYICDPTYGMYSVDNTLGFVVGDINKGSVQYAVKSNRAGLMGMYKVHQFIQKIRKSFGANLTDEILVQELFKMASKEGTVRQVSDSLGKNLEQTQNKLIEEYLKMPANINYKI